mmetsp:Transcript_20586/g.52395  ORF Transcript_20586/g.52395 Transcript_20586/m.52395 type:complete len:522 (+) Transcript_20586:3-1568(+)
MVLLYGWIVCPGFNLLALCLFRTKTRIAVVAPVQATAAPAETSNEPHSPKMHTATDAGETQVVLVTRAGERLGLELVKAKGCNLTVGKNAIQVPPGSALLCINKVDVRKMKATKVAKMLRDAHGAITLTFAASQPSGPSEASCLGSQTGFAARTTVSPPMTPRATDTPSSQLLIESARQDSGTVAPENPLVPSWPSGEESDGHAHVDGDCDDNRKSAASLSLDEQRRKVSLPRIAPLTKAGECADTATGILERTLSADTDVLSAQEGPTPPPSPPSDQNGESSAADPERSSTNRASSGSSRCAFSGAPVPSDEKKMESSAIKKKRSQGGRLNIVSSLVDSIADKLEDDADGDEGDDNTSLRYNESLDVWSNDELQGSIVQVQQKVDARNAATSDDQREARNVLELQMVTATLQAMLTKRRQELGWRSPFVYNTRVLLAWAFNVGVLMVACFFSIVYALKFQEAATRNMCMAWLVAYGVTFAVVEPVQVIVIALAPSLSDEDSRVGRFCGRCRFVYNELCAP